MSLLNLGKARGGADAPAAIGATALLSHERPQRIAERPEVHTAIARRRAAEQRVERRQARTKEVAAATAATLGALQQLEDRGEDPGHALAHAEASETAERRILAAALEERADARIDLDRALLASRRAAAPEWTSYIEALLAEQEEHLWKVLTLNLLIGRAVSDLTEDGVPLSVGGGFGFPGFPLVHSPQALFTSIRNRAVAPGRALCPIPQAFKERQ